MDKKIDVGNDLYEKVYELCGGDVRDLLMLTNDGGVHGMEGFGGLRLIANALHERTVARVFGTHVKPVNESLRAAQIHEGVKKVAKKANLPFIVCYHIDGSDHWRLAWSRGLTFTYVREELIQFIQSGRLFHDPDD